MNKFEKFWSSQRLRLTLLFIINVAIAFFATWFGYSYAYFAASAFCGIISIFFLAHRNERDSYKVLVFLTIFMLPLLGIGYGIALKEKKGSNKIKKEWSSITYRNRKTIYQSNETMEAFREVSSDSHKTCSYIVDTLGLPCYQNANIKYYSFGEAYYKDIFEELNKAQKYILFQCHKVVPGRIWNQLFDILRFKAREGVVVKFLYDDAVCTKFISRDDWTKMQNHGIETVPFNKAKKLFNNSFVNCRNFKRLCVIDGKVGFTGGFNVDDEYVNSVEFSNATKDCGVKMIGDAVKNLIIMFFEDYQYASKKVINVQEYFADNEVVKTKDWILPYASNPVVVEHTSKNILLSLMYNAKESISITTSHIALDDELKNALIVNAKSGVKVRIVFSSENVPSSIKNVSRSYFYELIKEGVEVYEYKGGKMSTRLIMIDNKKVLMSTNNLECANTYRHFNSGVFIYGESVIIMYNDMREIINNSQLVTIKDLQKRKLSEKISATWHKFLALFR